MCLLPYLSSTTSTDRCCLLYFQVMAVVLITSDNEQADMNLSDSTDSSQQAFLVNILESGLHTVTTRHY